MVPCFGRAVALFLAFSKAFVSAVPSSHVEHEKRDVQDELYRRSRVLPSMNLPVRIGLTQKDLDVGHDKLMEISDPDSVHFGKHYTAEEVEELFAPTKESVEVVRAWVEETIDSRRVGISTNKQWIQFDATAAELESLLHTTFYHYEGSGSDAFGGIGCDRYHVPSNVRKHVDYITPGVKMLNARHVPSLGRRSTPEPPGGRLPKSHPLNMSIHELNSMRPDKVCNTTFTPYCIKKLYNITDHVAPGTGSTLGIYEWEEQYYSPGALRKFFKAFAKHIPPDTKPRYLHIDGAPGPGYGQGKPHTLPPIEANLDLQTSYPIAYPGATIVNYQTDDQHYESKVTQAGIFNDLLDAIDGSYCNYTAFGITGNSKGIDPTYPDPYKGKGSYKGQLQCGKFKPTNVISLSYIEGEISLPMNYQRRQCNEFLKLALQGTSSIFASGDRGVAVHFNPTGHRSCLGHRPNLVFGPNYPVNCPYVTGVGATIVTQHDGVERAAKFSGGGFSNIYPTPDYQKQAVEAYLKRIYPPYKSYNVSYMPFGSKNGGRFNRGGRGFPDVSALGARVLGITNDTVTQYSGTSVSTPLFAAIIARINAARMAAGKGPVGFLNPIIYKHPEVFRDIERGHNAGCHSRGFYAVPGWDPASGLGTPDYPKLKALLMSLP